MKIDVKQNNGATYIECQENECLIEQEQDVLDLIALCGENDTNRLLIHENNLSPDFFDLKTGLAGAIFQKLANYYVRGVAVISFENIKSERFKELIYEYNKGNHFRFYKDKTMAIDWLTKS